MSAADRLEALEDLEWHLKQAAELYRALGHETDASLMQGLRDDLQGEKDEAQQAVNEEIHADLEELNSYYYSTRM